MRESIPRGPFDQGLFLAHFNKGKELYEKKRLEDAERELEEAYLLRPRDLKVLNLLGLVYFKQDKFEKAEEVYRKLVAESPEAHTLQYNLGLIYFKLNRLEDAEGSFLKALELAKDNAKINFYLGSIYERLHRFKDAIYQYRQAGANIMVRRVEDKMAQTAPPASPRPRRKDDTAEFLAGKVPRPASASTLPAAPPPPLPAPSPQARDEAVALGEGGLGFDGGKTLRPLSESLLAENAPDRSFLTETARFRLQQEDPTGSTLPPLGRARFPEIISFPQREQTLPPAAPPPAPLARPSADIFRFLENNLMEIDFAGKVFIKQGTIYSYSGNLTFWVKDRRPGGQPALVIITGTGKVILTDHDREVTFMQVEDETVYVEPSHLLACEEGLTPRYVSLGESAGGLEVLALEGRGMVALSVASKPLTLSVTPGLPVSVPASSVITWSGEVSPRIVDDQQIYEVMLPLQKDRAQLVRLEGSGRVLVEQTTR
jgi:tetratricopeptide (TPR) repeat protein